MAILEFINQFGYCNITHLQRRFNLGRAASYRVMSRLIKQSLVRHHYVYHGKPGVYQCTRHGAALTSFSSLYTIPLTNFSHDQHVIDVYF